VAHEIAHNWFGDEVFFSRFTAIGIGEGLPEYATIVAERETKGLEGRRALVSQYLRDYDEARKGAEEIPLGVTTRTDPPAQQFISEAKAALFFVAIEDACGEQQMHDGLKELLALLHGQEVSYGSLRSELEYRSRKNLAQVFRVWLNDKGVPADFRTRYQYSTNGAAERTGAN
jgi:aminopeptidase N